VQIVMSWQCACMMLNRDCRQGSTGLLIIDL